MKRYKLRRKYQTGGEFLCCGKDVGRGSFGSVKTVLDTDSGKTHVKKTFSSNNKAAYEREVLNMQTFTDDRFPKLLDKDDRSLDIYMTYHCGQSLEEIVEGMRGNMLPTNLIIAYMTQILQSIAILHERKHVHCDIKPENMIIDTNGNIIMVDMGSFVNVDELNVLKKNGQLQHSIAYAAPEILYNDHNHILTGKIDIWSIGMVCLYLFTGETVFGKILNYEIISNWYSINNMKEEIFDAILVQILEKRYNILLIENNNLNTYKYVTALAIIRDKYPDDLFFVQLIMRCLEKDPENRPNIHVLSGLLIELQQSFINEYKDTVVDPNKYVIKHVADNTVNTQADETLEESD